MEAVCQGGSSNVVINLNEVTQAQLTEKLNALVANKLLEEAQKLLDKGKAFTSEHLITCNLDRLFVATIVALGLGRIAYQSIYPKQDLCSINLDAKIQIQNYEGAKYKDGKEVSKNDKDYSSDSATIRQLRANIAEQKEANKKESEKHAQEITKLKREHKRECDNYERRLVNSEEKFKKLEKTLKREREHFKKELSNIKQTCDDLKQERLESKQEKDDLENKFNLVMQKHEQERLEHIQEKAESENKFNLVMQKYEQERLEREQERLEHIQEKEDLENKFNLTMQKHEQESTDLKNKFNILMQKHDEALDKMSNLRNQNSYLRTLVEDKQSLELLEDLSNEKKKNQELVSKNEALVEQASESLKEREHLQELYEETKDEVLQHALYSSARIDEKLAEIARKDKEIAALNAEISDKKDLISILSNGEL